MQAPPSRDSVWFYAKPMTDGRLARDQLMVEADRSNPGPRLPDISGSCSIVELAQSEMGVASPHKK